MTNTGANFFLAYLASELTEGGSETDIFLDRITTLTGETITTALFSTFGRGTLTVAPTVASSIENISFTGVDATNVKLTGAIRGLSSISDSVVAANKKYHPVGTQVIISFGIHDLNNLTEYIANLVSGEIGTATDTVGGSTKMTENLGTLPRAVSALVSEQTIPGMTLKVNPFSIVVLDSNVSYTGGNTGTFTAPVTNPRIDLVVYSTAGSALAIRTGTEGASPTEPTPTNGDIVLASVYHRVGETTIRERDISPNTQGYIKRWYTPVVYRTDLATQTYVNNFLKFGGTGADGALTIASGTTTLAMGGVRVFIRNYTSISITGTAKLAFSGAHADGTIIILKSQGDVTITSSTVPAIDVSGLGGGVAGNGASNCLLYTQGATSGSASGGTSIAGAAGIRATDIVAFNMVKDVFLGCGSGGGNGGGTNSFTVAGSGGGGASFLTNGNAGNTSFGSSSNGSGGMGGRGGAALLIECRGAYNFTGNISAAGVPGGNATGSSGNTGGGGGGGGGIVVRYNTLTANSGTYTVTGGIGGTSTSGGSGGNGATGYTDVGFNADFV